MTTGTINLDQLVREMADRDAPRTEANVQSALHALLLAAPLDLGEAQLRDLDVVLEQQAGARKRIDVEAGLCVFEVKRDLRKGNVRQDAVKQLAGYVASRTQVMNQRYVGVLTDGAEWHLYHLKHALLHPVSSFSVDPSKPDVEGLSVWLEGVLATGTAIAPTPPEIARRLGAESPGHKLDIAELMALYAPHRDEPTVKLKRELWARLLTTALGTGFIDTDELFVEHTLLVATAEVIAHAVVGLDPTAQDVTAAALLGGQLFNDAQIHGVVDADFFDWVVEVPGGDRFVKVLARRLARFTWREVEHDVLKVLYESVISAEQRKQLGEYYTPDWLADRIVHEAVSDPLGQRALDPSCGSGTFLFHAIRRYLRAADKAGQSNTVALVGVVEHVIGMDIHPVAVTFARVTYLLAIGPARLQSEDRPPISIPVYHVRNLARPVWLTRSANHVDVLIGNPPWLSYRFMTAEMQAEFRRLCEERGIWTGAGVATNQDLSALFILRSVERYLRPGGRFGFVMPWSILRGRQYSGFRKGRYSLVQSKDLTVSFDDAWDLRAVKPAFFPVPSCVLFGTHAESPHALPSSVEEWSGRLPQSNIPWNKAKKHITRARGSVQEAKDAVPGTASFYDTRFVQGATIVPRVLLVVEPQAPGPLGFGVGRIVVRSRRSASEKKPWKSVPSLEASVDRQFVRSMHIGETILPYRSLKPLKAIVPWDGKRLLHGRDERLGRYPGLEKWWREAEAIWEAHRSSERLSLIERLDYHKGMSQQLPPPPRRVVYNASGMYLAAAVLQDDAVIEHGLYWAAAATVQEARFLAAIINSDVVIMRVRPLQARGEHNPRHYDKYIWQLPIPIYDPTNERHVKLAGLAEQAEQIAAAVDLPAGKRFETLRGLIRKAIAATEVGRQIEEEVAALLG